jgi:hypothetical protein
MDNDVTGKELREVFCSAKLVVRTLQESWNLLDPEASSLNPFLDSSGSSQVGGEMDVYIFLKAYSVHIVSLDKVCSVNNPGSLFD